MKKYQIIFAAACISFIPELAQALSQGTVVYACTRRASAGVTQTYIAPIKNGVPVCNNRKHVGPFVLLDTSLLGSTGVPGAQGAQGPQGAPGANGKDGAAGSTGEQGPIGDQGPDGTGRATVMGQLVTCDSSFEMFNRVRGFGGFRGRTRQAFCTLEGTSFLYRTLNSDSCSWEDSSEKSSEKPLSLVSDEQVNDFAFHHVPDGTYTLTCDTETGCPLYRFATSSVQVTVVNGETVDVGTQNLCQFCSLILE